MANTYYGLVWWQWLLVTVLAVHESAAVTMTISGFAGALVGTLIAFYIIARLIAMASRGLRSRVGRRATPE